MLNLSVQHAVTLLNDLKLTPGKNLETISQERGISRYFLEQISRKLRIEGMLAAKRGPSGGYILMRNDVKLGELLRLFQPKSLRETENSLNTKIVKQLAKLEVLQ